MKVMRLAVVLTACWIATIAARRKEREETEPA